MKIEPGQMVPLGCGKYFRSDRIVGLEPIEEGQRSGTAHESVYRTAGHPDRRFALGGAILVTWSRCPRRSKIREQRELLSDLVDTISEINPLLRSIIRDQGSGISTAWKNGSAMSCARMKNDPPLRASRRGTHKMSSANTWVVDGSNAWRRTCAAINSLTDESSRIRAMQPRNMTLPQRGVCWVRRSQRPVSPPYGTRAPSSVR